MNTYKSRENEIFSFFVNLLIAICGFKRTRRSNWIFQNLLHTRKIYYPFMVKGCCFGWDFNFNITKWYWMSVQLLAYAESYARDDLKQRILLAYQQISKEILGRAGTSFRNQLNLRIQSELSNNFKKVNVVLLVPHYNIHMKINGSLV